MKGDFMRRVNEMLERGFHGALMGGFISIVSGYVEYVLIRMQNTYVGNLTAGYWDIMIPYALFGLIGGVIIAAVVGLVSGRAGAQQATARLGATLAACVPLAYLMVRAAYNWVPPIWKLSNLIAYGAAVIASLVTGWLVYHAMRLLLSRVARRGAVPFWRVAAPVLLMAGIVLVLIVPSRFAGPSPTVPVAVQPVAQASATPTQPNIIFILLDTLRADHLPMYGYSRQTAPRLTALAKNGMTFKRMYAPASATRPSVASIFSSLYPAVHKTNHERDYLPNAVVTLAEVLREGGYQSLAIAANPNISPVFGFAQGFDHYEMAYSDSAFKITTLGSVAEDALGRQFIDKLFAKGTEFSGLADNMTHIALKRVAERERKPTFLYVHYIDPHWPYTPPQPYDRAFDAERNPSIRQADTDPLQLAQGRVEQRKVSHTLDQYDGEILFTDHHVGRLLDGLERLGMLQNALIIVTSDHGEEFWEHGQRGHDKTLYEEVLHVPFLMSWPGRIPAGSTFDEMANLVDVMPTVLDMVGLRPVPGLQGFSLQKQLLQQASVNPQRKFFAQQQNNQRAIEMVRHHRYKFVRHLRGPQQGLEEFYDLERDPLERRNLAPLAQTQVDAWRTELDLFNKLAQQSNLLVEHQQVDKLDDDMVKALRSLGYLQ
ncbi:MAG: hypothetical protein ETSY1_10480 [Candidatus Entotheonella factor]|uniref:Sulfatase N-terminal domain-containing protein n=1 Tax=Entotheonella factor TaxID=1429438 RepID=W4LT76_ENTF1|nr:MAG: hypothetical protein ETSY1_10480 [Candidatus Entotheonella factor]